MLWNKYLVVDVVKWNYNHSGHIIFCKNVIKLSSLILIYETEKKHKNNTEAMFDY